MVELSLRDPFQEMTSLRTAMNQLLSESFVRSAQRGNVPAALDMYETENDYVVRLAVPGLKPDNFEITLQQNVLTMSGRTQPEQAAAVRYHVREQLFGNFTRTIQFPALVNAEQIQAHLADGILTITLPKAEAAKPRRITVQTS